MNHTLEHSHTGPRGTIYHIHIDDTPPDGPLAEREEYTVATEEELEYEATIAKLEAQNADLLAALEGIALGACCQTPGCNTDDPKCYVMEACAAIAHVKGETG